MMRPELPDLCSVRKTGEVNEVLSFSGSPTELLHYLLCHLIAGTHTRLKQAVAHFLYGSMMCDPDSGMKPSNIIDTTWFL